MNRHQTEERIAEFFAGKPRYEVVFQSSTCVVLRMEEKEFLELLASWKKREVNRRLIGYSRKKQADEKVKNSLVFGFPAGEKALHIVIETEGGNEDYIGEISSLWPYVIWWATDTANGKLPLSNNAGVEGVRWVH